MGITPQQAGFASAVLRGIGARATPQNIAGFVGWSKAEGGDNWVRNNPLNTTESAGATRTINSAGVKAYANSQAGIRATVQTLRNGRYGGIINAFKSNNPRGLAGAIGSSPWGTSGSLAAQTIAQTLGQPVPRASGMGGGVIPGGGATGRQSAGQTITSTTVPTFNQAGYQQAQQRYAAGVAEQAASKLPALPNVSRGFASKLGDPNSILFSSGALTTAAPNAQAFTGSQVLHTTVAQNNLQQLAGQPLTTHPGATKGADKILAMARSVLGAPYNQATHATAFTQSAAQVRRTGTDCSGFVSWLMGPDGLGIWRSALATPDIQHAPGIQSGQGRSITIYNNPLPGNSGHVFIQIDGQFFQSAGGGTGIKAIGSAEAQQMIRSGDNGARYYALHPKGY